MRRWIGLAAAAALAFTTGVAPVVVLAAPAATPALSAYSERSRQLGALTDEASRASEGLSTWLGFNKLPREEMVAFLERELPNLELARAKLQAVQAKYDALPPFKGSPEETRIIAALQDDGRAYAVGMEEVLGAVEELLRALIANDQSRMAAAAPKVSRVAIVLVDGQIAMARGRQALFARDSGGYYIMGTMGALYDGMKASLTVSLRLATPADAAQQMRAAARRCREYVVAGRPVVDRVLATASPGDRAYYAFDREQLAIGGEIAAALETAADTMATATDPMDAFRATMALFTDLETRFADSATRQGTLI
jgi:hypothetical protein